MIKMWKSANTATDKWARDAALARRAAGDQSARETIFGDHCDAVYRLALRLLGNREDAEDAVQETFIEVFRSLGSYRGQASLGSWVHRITVRTALRHRRRARRPPPPELSLLWDHRPQADAATLFDERRAERAISVLLERLSDSRRAVFLLHEVEGYSLPEAAALLDISLTAAKKLVWRARGDLARLVEKDAMLSQYLDGGLSRRRASDD